MLTIFDFDFDAIFDGFGIDFLLIFGPLGPPKIGVAPARELDFHFFRPFSADALREPKLFQNDPQKDPKIHQKAIKVGEYQ